MKKLISMILILVVLFSVSCATAEREEGKTYSRLAVVVGCEQMDNVYMITCQDKDGNLWQFFDDERYWKICDLCNLLMFAYGMLLGEKKWWRLALIACFLGVFLHIAFSGTNVQGFGCALTRLRIDLTRQQVPLLICRNLAFSTRFSASRLHLSKTFYIIQA